MYAVAASAEQFSEHPLGKAVVRCYKQTCSDEIAPAKQFIMVPGRGVSAVVEEKEVLAGNRELLKEHHIDLSAAVLSDTERYLAEGSTIIYIAVDGIWVGYLVLSDTIRLESEKMIQQLTNLGVCPVLLTGDNENAADTIAKQLHISEVHANCLPEDKLKWIDAYQQDKESICMIGDGVNDAPALKKANTSIAMGGIGSDIAIDAADIALVDDEVKELPHLLALSKRMMLTIKCNLTFSMGLNFLAIILAITGILNPVIGALVHNAGSVLVIINSAFLLKWRKKG